MRQPEIPWGDEDRVAPCPTLLACRASPPCGFPPPQMRFCQEGTEREGFGEQSCPFPRCLEEGKEKSCRLHPKGARPSEKALLAAADVGSTPHPSPLPADPRRMLPMLIPSMGQKGSSDPHRLHLSLPLGAIPVLSQHRGFCPCPPQLGAHHGFASGAGGAAGGTSEAVPPLPPGPKQ